MSIPCKRDKHSRLFHFSFSGTITSWVVIFILPINSALNPILYTLTTRPFKEMIHQIWYNYRQRRSIDSKGSQKAPAPSFIWVEMWPTQEMPPDLRKPAAFTDPCEVSLISQSTRLNSDS
jgi:leucine-rich repeat-containing G protein-coupled receptor 7